jgi:hypothetical protein
LHDSVKLGAAENWNLNLKLVFLPSADGAGQVGAAVAAAAILSSSGVPVAAALLPVRNKGEKITNFNMLY